MAHALLISGAAPMAQGRTDMLETIAIILLVLWLLGWVVRPGRRRWYYW